MNTLPTKVNFDVCTFCNHACTFCSNSDKRMVKSSVSYKDFKKVMDNITKYLSIKELGLSAKGEVLINKDLPMIVASSKNIYNIEYVYISSNGALLNSILAEELLNSGLNSIKFSINALDSIEYRDIHKKDDFDLVIENMKNLIELKENFYPNLKILISCINNKSEEEILKKFQSIFGNKYKYIDKILKYNITYTPKFENINIDKSKLKPCPLVFNEIYIDSDCRLGLCCKDYFKEFDYGNLLEYDFLDLYNSTKMKKIRNAHKSLNFKDYDFCKKCLIFNGLNDEK